MEAPRITIYYRVLDNSTQNEIRETNFLDSKDTLLFGDINGIQGGESPYIIEFDIWNNEPDFNGLSGMSVVSDAINCRFTAWDDETQTSTMLINENGVYLIHARCVTKDYNSNFKPIGGPNQLFDIYGNVDFTKGELKGIIGGEHTKIQTKIVIPDSSLIGYQLSPGERHFVFSFSYDYM